MKILVLKNWYKTAVPSFGAAYFTSIYVSINSAKFYKKIVKVEDFSRSLSYLSALFKANLFFKDLSKKLFIFKYFSSLCEL